MYFKTILCEIFQLIFRFLALTWGSQPRIFFQLSHNLFDKPSILPNAQHRRRLKINLIWGLNKYAKQVYVLTDKHWYREKFHYQHPGVLNCLPIPSSEITVKSKDILFIHTIHWTEPIDNLFSPYLRLIK